MTFQKRQVFGRYDWEDSLMRVRGETLSKWIIKFNVFTREIFMVKTEIFMVKAMIIFMAREETMNESTLSV